MGNFKRYKTDIYSHSSLRSENIGELEEILEKLIRLVNEGLDEESSQDFLDDVYESSLNSHIKKDLNFVIKYLYEFGYEPTIRDSQRLSLSIYDIIDNINSRIEYYKSQQIGCDLLCNALHEVLDKKYVYMLEKIKSTDSDVANKMKDIRV